MLKKCIMIAGLTTALNATANQPQFFVSYLGGMLPYNDPKVLEFVESSTHDCFRYPVIFESVKGMKGQGLKLIYAPVSEQRQRDFETMLKGYFPKKSEQPLCVKVNKTK